MIFNVLKKEVVKIGLCSVFVMSLAACSGGDDDKKDNIVTEIDESCPNPISAVVAMPGIVEVGDTVNLSVLTEYKQDGSPYIISWDGIVIVDGQTDVSGYDVVAPYVPGKVTYNATVINTDTGDMETQAISFSVVGEGELNSTPVSKFSTPNHVISVPGELSYIKDVPVATPFGSRGAPAGNFDGAILYANDAGIAGERSLLAFGLEKKKQRSGNTTRQELEDLVQSITNNIGVASNISTGAIRDGKIWLGIYIINRSPEAITNMMSEVVNVVMGGNLENMPQSSLRESVATKYRLYLTVSKGATDDKVVILGGLVHDEDNDQWENTISRFTSGRNIQ